MKKEDKEKEEEIEEELDESEEEEEKLTDILLEEEIERNSSKLQRFLSSVDTSSSLDQRNFTPILNLEEDLPAVKKEQTYEEDEAVNYLVSEEEKHNYNKKEMDFSGNMGSKNLLSEDELLENKQKHLYSTMGNVSSEMAFVQKSMKPEYVKAKAIDEDSYTKEHKRSVENVIEKMKENYR